MPTAVLGQGAKTPPPTTNRPPQMYYRIRQNYRDFARISPGLHWVWERKSDAGTPPSKAFEEKVDLWRVGNTVIESHPQSTIKGHLSDRVRIAQPGSVTHVFYPDKSSETPSLAVVLPDSQITPTSKAHLGAVTFNGAYGLGATLSDPYIDPVLMLNTEPFTGMFETAKDGITTARIGSPQMLGDREFLQREVAYDKQLRPIRVALIAEPERFLRFEGRVTKYRTYQNFSLPSEIKFTEWSARGTKPLHYTLNLISVGFDPTDFKLPIGLSVCDYRNQAHMTEALLGRRTAVSDIDPALQGFKPMKYKWSGSFPLASPVQFTIQPASASLVFGLVPLNLLIGAGALFALGLAATVAVRREMKVRR